jgi:hypothetical protein
MHEEKSRKGEVWRGEIAQHIESYLAGETSAAELADWAMDHPFFDDRSDLTEDDQRIIALGLGSVLQFDPTEPDESRTTEHQLREAVVLLWRGTPPQV